MGFKRTAEGRVFFENPSGDENQDNKDLQVVGLLRALNERLKTAQSERARLLRDMERYEDTIEDLKERAVRSEQAYIDLEQKVSSRQNESVKKVDRTEQVTKETLQELMDTREMLAELEEKTMLTEKNFSSLKEELSERKKTEDLLRKHQLALEKMHKDQNEKIVGSVAAYVALTKRVNESESKFDKLDNKIEEAAAGHALLERKIEKAIQDRGRLLRKIDRIEETVIQTRDALNAKAMVVLADQGVHGIDSAAAQKLLGEEPAPALLENQMRAGQAWWQKTGLAQVAGTAMVLAAVLLVGFSLSRINLPEWRTFDKEQFSFFEDRVPSASADKTAAQDTEEWLPVLAGEDTTAPTQEDQPEAAADSIAAVEQETGPVINRMEIVNQMEIADVGAADDIGTLDLNDEDQLLAALESNPDGLAAQLNAIEPSSVDVAAEVEQTAPQEPQTATEQEALQPIAPEDDNEPVMTLAPRPGLEGRIKPDPALPEIVKQIENQAFAGVPEAQHDLAAIYTAGHGGVKQNYKRAGLWFREAAEGGIANARYNLGVLYHQGLGVEQDTAEAIRWYKSAAALGHPEAQYNLGIAYIEGVGVPYDPRKAAGYFKSAADSGIMEASYNLGLIYENALLGKAQPDEALRWYKTAADAGSPEAKAALEQLAKTLNIKLSDVNKLVESIGSNGKTAPAKAPTATAPTAKTAPKKVVKQAPVAAPQPVKEKPEAAVNIEPAAGTAAETAPPPDTGRMLTAQVQQYLMQLGLYPGPADGLRGPLTKDAIRSYQLFNDLADTGEVTEALLSHMRSDPQINEVGSRAQ